MTPLADLVRQLGSAGCSIEQIAVAVAHQENLMHEREAQRKAANTARQKRWRVGVSRRYETLHNATPPPIDTTPPLDKKPKRVSISIDPADLSEIPPDWAIAFAEGKGWERGKISHEWQRFRNYGIQKDRKHKGQRGLTAAWQNWVTSPYQKPVENGNVQTTQRNHCGAYGASKDRFREAYAELKAFNAANVGGDSGGEVVEFLPAAGRERA